MMNDVKTTVKPNFSHHRATCTSYAYYYGGTLFMYLVNRVTHITLLYSWRFSRYSAPIHWLVHGHMTSNNETVSRQMPRAGKIAKTMTSNGKQFTVTLYLPTFSAI